MSMQIEGYCPMGCGNTLFLASDGQVTCMKMSCPDDKMASKILSDPVTDHVVVLRGQSFDVLHPLNERPKGLLFDCDLHGYLSSLDVPPATPGRYRAFLRDGTWNLEAL